MKVLYTQFLWKLLEQMFYQNKRVNQERTMWNPRSRELNPGKK